MFTEGLDENAIKWIMGSDAEAEHQKPQQPRSPLAQRISSDSYPRSPSVFTPSQALPPLKFHSGLVTPRGLVTPSVLGGDEDDDNDEESVDSVSDSSYSYEDVLGSNDSKPSTQCYYNDEELFGYKPSTNSK